MDNLIRQRILQLNPWLATPARLGETVRRQVPATWIPRRIDLGGFSDRTRAKLIVGPRQVGKSTWLWHHLGSRPPASLLYLQCEEALVRAWLDSPVAFLDDLGRELPEVDTLFIEEAQHLADAGLVVKGLVDARLDLDIFVTGSSAFHLDAGTRESLAGRAVRRVLWPLSLAEVAAAKPGEAPLAATARADAAVDRQWLYGGYPRPFLTGDPEGELADLVEAFIIRDASDRFRIQHVNAFRRLLQLAATQAGQMVNLSEWSAHLGIAASTVRDYLTVLEESFIIQRVPAFSGGRRSEITSAQRVHFCDVGVRNAVIRAFGPDLKLRPDRGALAESWVFGEILKSVPRPWGVHYWRAKGGAEMDVVLVLGDRLIGVEVKAGRATVSRSVRSFADAYAPETIVLVSGAAAETPPPLGPTSLVTSSFAALGGHLERLTGQGGGPAV